ncbi:MAG: hypothetical protein OSA95_09060, partial [Opitutales bacterium]|nr:hypothetical protein [Opitutales bacterium]
MPASIIMPFKLILSIVLIGANPLADLQAAASRPNILLLFVDDMGWRGDASAPDGWLEVHEDVAHKLALRLGAAQLSAIVTQECAV